MNQTAKRAASVAFACLFFSSIAAAAEPEKHEGKATSKLDTTGIEKAIGKAGEMKGDVYKISFPRKDLSVTVKGVKVKPGLALGSWVAFTEGGDKAVMDGDLVLTEDEVGPVFEKLRKEGIEITALHNHLIGETPRVMFLHVAGRGDAADLAKNVKAALSLTATPMGESKGKLGEIVGKMAPEETGFSAAEQIQEALGHKGNVKDGVLQISVPRPEHIKMEGAILPPTMGMGTALNFQAAGDGKVAATGDFVLVKEEVDGVTKALAEHGILVTALHNHLVHGTPDLYFIHFWVHDSADKVAKGLRAGLDAMKQSKKES